LTCQFRRGNILRDGWRDRFASICREVPTALVGKPQENHDFPMRADPGRDKFFVGIFSATAGWSQKITGLERDQTQSMLREIASDVKKHYYDPTLHGLDWDRSVGEAKARIDQAGDIGQAVSEIAALLDLLKDSHTFFMPPARFNRYDYGWEAQTIGTHCYVTQVRPGTDAAAKGVTPGDEILTVNSFPPTKQNLTRMEYLLKVLRPQPALHLELRAPDGKTRTIDVATKITEGNRARDFSPGEDVEDKERTIETMKVWRHKRTEDIGRPTHDFKAPGVLLHSGRN
jgi:hypothetical protein